MGSPESVHGGHGVGLVLPPAPAGSCGRGGVFLLCISRVSGCNHFKSLIPHVVFSFSRPNVL